MLNVSLDRANLFGNLLNQSRGFNPGLSFRGSEIAADVLIPDPRNKYGAYAGNIRQDYPQLPEKGVPYHAVGAFGNVLPSDSPMRKYGYTTEGDRGIIRGQMNFVPGGIPASEGFNYEESLKKYPNEMKGIPRGNMPVYYAPSVGPY